MLLLVAGAVLSSEQLSVTQVILGLGAGKRHLDIALVAVASLYIASCCRRPYAFLHSLLPPRMIVHPESVLNEARLEP